MGVRATINSYDEIFLLGNFVENKEITLENFENIVVDYEIKDTELKCCLTDEKGKCGQIHQKGYLVLLSDGTYSLMGGTCGRTKFNADSTISKNIASFENERKRQEKLGSLYDFINNKEKYQNIINSLKEIVGEITAFYREIQILGFNLKILNDRYKSSDRAVLIKTYKYDEKGNSRYQTTERIGYLQELNLFDAKDTGSYGLDVHRLIIGLKKACELDDQIKQKPKARVDKQVNDLVRDLSHFESLQDELLMRKSSIERFKNSDLSLLCYLTNSYHLRQDAAKYFLRSKGRDISKTESYLANKDSSYLDQYSCDELRVKSKH
ncbi:hypothetical protein P255_02860 [Acinetobacter brisouii CIP 110357]|uniref:Uncharacterized protein n=1 Tax=Acinetobacter brisouii CIP 110357 TaxID=1341683 RepID=V2UCF8_9GAMM|nr:hypothetical protein [Acinetobacter brisouii]ENV48802.1 hypothetical protein F954_00192 [Acinetobacter brisouii ANC 4119]ESK48217.1 hypothetical protein P255_02860 [Acinetobacter brisouii CIP 110357]